MIIIDNACVIDDDPICVFGIKRTLKQINFCDNITVYNNGLDAINAFNVLIAAGEKLPSVVFLDLNMPIMDGWDFLDDFMKIPNHHRDNVTISIVSSSVDPRDMLKAKEYSAVKNYFFKPITPTDLDKIKTEFLK